MSETDTDSQARGSLLETISVLLPTRQRPDMLKRALASLFDMADHPAQIEVLVYADNDDLATTNLDLTPWNTKQVVRTRQTMGTMLSTCLAESSGDIIVLGSDDIVVRTPGWDARLRSRCEKFPDSVYLFYPNDLFKKRRLCTFPILSRRTCELLGEPFPVSYKGAFLDVHLFDIFQRVRGHGFDRIVFLEDVIFEHMHHRLGKSTLDRTYKDRPRFGDDDTFLSLAPKRAQAAANLAAVVSGNSTIAPSPQPLPKSVQSRALATWRLLLDTNAPMIWRIRVSVWMSLRLIYRYLTGQAHSGTAQPPANKYGR